MAFSDCHPDKFTCSNGKCIDLTSKCDSVIDCDEDASDEEDCEFLVVQKGEYSKNKVPPKRRLSRSEARWGIFCLCGF